MEISYLDIYAKEEKLRFFAGLVGKLEIIPQNLSHVPVSKISLFKSTSFIMFTWRTGDSVPLKGSKTGRRLIFIILLNEILSRWFSIFVCVFGRTFKSAGLTLLLTNLAGFSTELSLVLAFEKTCLDLLLSHVHPHITVAGLTAKIQKYASFTSLYLKMEASSPLVFSKMTRSS